MYIHIYHIYITNKSCWNLKNVNEKFKSKKIFLWLHIGLPQQLEEIYKDAVQSIIVDNEITFSSSARTCDYETCTFCDENHGHIIIRDLRLTKLRSLLILSKGPN